VEVPCFVPDISSWGRGLGKKNVEKAEENRVVSGPYYIPTKPVGIDEDRMEPGRRGGGEKGSTFRIDEMGENAEGVSAAEKRDDGLR